MPEIRQKIGEWSFTAETQIYPPYINVSRFDDDSFEITVREPPTADGRCGATVVMPVAADNFKTLLRPMAAEIL
jgi:hypothetical protein